MSDIVDRLRASVTQCRAVDRSQLLEEAAGEIEKLSNELNEKARSPTLTNAELRAVRTAAFAYAQNDDDTECEEIASALLGLAERLK